MVEFTEIKFSYKPGDSDALFKSAKQLSEESGEELNSSTFMTAEDVLNHSGRLFVLEDLPQENSEILRDFVPK